MFVKLLILTVIAYTAVQAYFLDGLSADKCSSDADCVGGCCYQDPRHGRQCHNISAQSQPCHLPNVTIHVMLYPCGCQSGLKCTPIHLGAGDNDPVHKAELLLLGHGYGWCQ